MNKLREVVKGTNYSIMPLARSSTAFITHKPTNAYVAVTNNGNHIRILEGKTPNSARGRGIGTNLRALATLYAIFSNKPISQTGENMEDRSKIRRAKNPNAKNIPTSTFILRERLGWKKLGNNNRNSNFSPKRNNNKNVRNWLTGRGFMF
jgi:hypothetical protein